jgi:hypothetical protein
LGQGASTRWQAPALAFISIDCHHLDRQVAYKSLPRNCCTLKCTMGSWNCSACAHSKTSRLKQDRATQCFLNTLVKCPTEPEPSRQSSYLFSMPAGPLSLPQLAPLGVRLRRSRSSRPRWDQTSPAPHSGSGDTPRGGCRSSSWHSPHISCGRRGCTLRCKQHTLLSRLHALAYVHRHGTCRQDSSSQTL